MFQFRKPKSGAGGCPICGCHSPALNAHGCFVYRAGWANHPCIGPRRGSRDECPRHPGEYRGECDRCRDRQIHAAGRIPTAWGSRRVRELPDGSYKVVRTRSDAAAGREFLPVEEIEDED